MAGTFATAINCMDGRAQLPVIEWMLKEQHVEHVDMVTEVGPNRILAENTDAFLINSIRDRVALSVKKHGSKLIAVVGHHDCAGNPSDENEQLQHLEAAARLVQKWGFQTKILKLWVDEDRKVAEVDSEPRGADS
jgi:carbonic anhydrase